MHFTQSKYQRRSYSDRAARRAQSLLALIWLLSHIVVVGALNVYCEGRVHVAERCGVMVPNSIVILADSFDNQSTHKSIAFDEINITLRKNPTNYWHDSLTSGWGHTPVFIICPLETFTKGWSRDISFEPFIERGWLTSLSNEHNCTEVQLKRSRMPVVLEIQIPAYGLSDIKDWFFAHEPNVGSLPHSKSPLVRADLRLDGVPLQEAGYNERSSKGDQEPIGGRLLFHRSLAFLRIFLAWLCACVGLRMWGFWYLARTRMKVYCRLGLGSLCFAFALLLVQGVSAIL